MKTQTGGKPGLLQGDVGGTHGKTCSIRARGYLKPEDLFRDPRWSLPSNVFIGGGDDWRFGDGAIRIRAVPACTHAGTIVKHVVPANTGTSNRISVIPVCAHRNIVKMSYPRTRVPQTSACRVIPAGACPRMFLSGAGMTGVAGSSIQNLLRDYLVVLRLQYDCYRILSTCRQCPERHPVAQGGMKIFEII